MVREVFEQSPTSGQPSVLLQHPNGASCEIQLHGATVTSYKTAQGREVLFLSQTAVFNGCQAIRGGIPVVFPQFLRPDPTLPSHGFARTSAWELSDEEKESGASPGAVTAVLTLSDSAATRALWPFAFHLRYVVELEETQLTTTLHITNTSDAAFRCQVDTVLWNPWEAKGAGMKDLERDGYQRFVCVEPGLVSAPRSVAPSERLTLAQTLASPH
ncbi:hypothetical protein JKP88DRAFT_271260 [Tribonema minus]|uniref:Glucose-6-phosphate 1-epimerase n=1 Tax=Tribonema minus TaxID=303371 RepID=A0A835ZF20_9STRA|nr:hypothetical protein JKP88DRAFT_271260 [Tribonema minus]